MSAPLTKAKELEILREAAHRLGAESYCGAWLLGQLPEIEADMKADRLPVTGWAELRRLEAETITAAREQAAQILEDAGRTSNRLRSDAQEFATEVRTRTHQKLRDILATIG